MRFQMDRSALCCSVLLGSRFDLCRASHRQSFTHLLHPLQLFRNIRQEHQHRRFQRCHDAFRPRVRPWRQRWPQGCPRQARESKGQVPWHNLFGSLDSCWVRKDVGYRSIVGDQFADMFRIQCLRRSRDGWAQGTLVHREANSLTYGS
jgi:hypothetical protein